MLLSFSPQKVLTSLVVAAAAAVVAAAAAVPAVYAAVAAPHLSSRENSARWRTRLLL